MRGPSRRADAIAAEAVKRTWPMASTAMADQLAGAASVIEDARGALLTQGERPSRVALVLNGIFVGTWIAADGRVAEGLIVEVDASGPGLFVGVSTLTGAPIISGIDALTPVTMLVWPSQEFRSIGDSDLNLTLDMLERSVAAIQNLNHLMQLRTFTTAASRLASVLLRYEN
jgi:CRP-like cAMP-binding protein